MSQKLTHAERELLAEARAAFGRAYAPYSHFRVGAAVRSVAGEVFGGCNVENATYGATVCAERNAVAAAVRGGARRIDLCVIFTDHVRATPPCGICRQVLTEFAAEATVVSVTAAGDVARWRLEDLLPAAFEPSDLDDEA